MCRIKEENLLDILSDEVISERLKLEISKVKELREQAKLVTDK